MKQKIFDICNKLTNQGVKPTLERVRAELGGGSFSTINPLLKEWKESRSESQATITASELPADIAKIGQKAAAMVWTVANEHCNELIQSIRRDADLASEQMQIERDEALKEVQRLETENDKLSGTVTEQRDLIRQLQIELGTKTALLEQVSSDKTTLSTKLEKALKEAAQAEGMLKAFRETTAQPAKKKRNIATSEN